MRRKRQLLSILLSIVLILSSIVSGCSKNPSPVSLESPPPQQPTSTPTETQQQSGITDISQTALRSEQAIAETEGQQAAQPSPNLPPDHWLVGTSDAPDMLPAAIAEDAPRELIAEYGPAFLEKIGNDRVLHLKGSHYDMGFQHGTILKEEIIQAAKLVESIGRFAWKGDYAQSIREAWERTKPFIPEKYIQEIRGLAEATGLTEEEVQNFTIFPELFHCSGFAVWGKATTDGSLLHGRVLDYMREAGLDKYALLIIFEPDEGNAWVNVGYSGMLGSVTGMNLKHVAIGEMGGRGEGKWDGMPMTLLVRHCLESANTIEEVRQIMETTPRTCEYYYVISDSKAHDGRGHALGVAATPEQIQFIGPNESHPLLPRAIEDAVLLSANERYVCLANRVEKMYGKITPQIALDIMARGVAMKSNMHNALFKPATLELWVAHSTVDTPAANRPYRHYDIKQLMAERPEKATTTP